ncbi:MAG: cobyrinate a,c-diamide synthase [Burkholderiaceae bacterium]|nr:cobyrinate a,c-diamide synthase [Burkholderiaceae bacterium]
MPTCPALMISAPASGQGKTSVTAALARAARRQGRRVRVFKTGPDYLDPMVLERASGHPVYQLDLFMAGLEACRQLLAQAAADADLILVEGVMGLFDGQPSSADLAAAFGLPVLAVLDASGMAQTFAALATGLQRFRADIEVCGVVANRVGSEAHGRMLTQGLPENLPLVAALPRQDALSLPERHLGLIQALEMPNLERQLETWADAWDQVTAASGQSALQFARPVSFTLSSDEAANTATYAAQPLKGRRIAVAQDACFSFIYPANLDTLKALGAELRCFSPLAGEALPECDALWLPGGYPELHARALTGHPGFFASLRSHLQMDKPLLAECGGMLCLLDQLTDIEGTTHAMASLMPGHARMQARLAALGLQSLAWPEGKLRGHSFHYSSLDTPLQAASRAHNPNGGRTAEALYLQGSLRASYVHHYFASNPEVVAAFFNRDRSTASHHCPPP